MYVMYTWKCDWIAFTLFHCLSLTAMDKYNTKIALLFTLGRDVIKYLQQYPCSTTKSWNIFFSFFFCLFCIHLYKNFLWERSNKVFILSNEKKTALMVFEEKFVRCYCNCCWKIKLWTKICWYFITILFIEKYALKTFGSDEIRDCIYSVK